MADWDRRGVLRMICAGAAEGAPATVARPDRLDTRDGGASRARRCAAAASPAVRLSKLGGSTMRWFVVTGSLQREIALLARAGARRDEACEWLGTVR